MKAAIIIFLCYNGSYDYLYVKRVTCNDDPTENYQQTLQFF